MIRHPIGFLLLIAAGLTATPAFAQATGEGRAAPTVPSGLTAQEFQGLSCLGGGSFAAAGAWTYSEIIVTATAVEPAAPLLVPIVATAFVAGCGVGSTLSPGLLWIFRQFE